MTAGHGVRDVYRQHFCLIRQCIHRPAPIILLPPNGCQVIPRQSLFGAWISQGFMIGRLFWSLYKEELPIFDILENLLTGRHGLKIAGKLYQYVCERFAKKSYINFEIREKNDD